MLQADGADDRWAGWVAATHTHNWVEQDPVVDWLNLYGRQNGFVPDNEQPGYDPRFDYVHAVLKQAAAFERSVVAWLSTVEALTTIATSPTHARMPAKAEETLSAMREGAPIIAQAVLWDPDERMDGIVDLLIRSDVLARLCTEAFASEPAGATAIAAPALGSAAWHYRAVDIKFTNINRRHDGEVSDRQLAHKVQVWIYNEALGKAQGYTPPASYLLGRDLFQALGRVSHADRQLGRLAAEGANWIRRLQKDGSSWRPTPFPTIDELRPNLKAWGDPEWHAAKLEIGRAQRDLTILPYVTPHRRSRATRVGITRWDDPALSAKMFGLADSADGRRIDAVLAANRDPVASTVVPTTISTNLGDWQTPAEAECFVVLQQVNDQMDDFSRIPQRGGTEMVYMVCWGWLDERGRWQESQLIARDLSEQAEKDLARAWRAELERMAAVFGVRLGDIRLFHWGSTRLLLHELYWQDLLYDVILGEPVAVHGSFGFGLADVTNALQKLGLIESAIPSLPPGPLAAMAAAWWSAAEAARQGTTLDQIEPIGRIAAYSAASCRSMMEVVGVLRRRAARALQQAA